VFGEVEVADAEEVHANWEAIKAAEKRRTSALEGIPTALPALAYADKLLGRLDRSDLGAVTVPPDDSPAGRIGADLFDVVRTARDADVDPEQALRTVLARYGEAVRAAEG
jgi:XTP/dITP diphosphohydrolase